MLLHPPSSRPSFSHVWLTTSCSFVCSGVMRGRARYEGTSYDEHGLTSSNRRVSACVSGSRFSFRDSTRGIRFFLEYEKPEEHLRKWGIVSTIVVIGSARVSEDPNFAAGRCWYRQARQFARTASERGGALSPVSGLRHNVIATGGGPGIMEAANRGAADVGAPSIGFNIQLPHEQTPNPYSTADLTFQFHYFCDAQVALG